MSFRNSKSLSVSSKFTITSPSKKISSAWRRPADWQTLPTVSSSDQKFVGLYEVKEYSNNFCALSATGDYTVDWGDGTIENFASGVTAEHVYSYAQFIYFEDRINAFSGTDRFSASGTTNFANYPVGTRVRLFKIGDLTSGLIEGGSYYVSSNTGSRIYLSTTLDGPSITFNGASTFGLSITSAIRNPVLITVTPQAGQTLTSIDINKRHSQAGTTAYNASWVDIAVGSPNFTSITISAASPLVNLVSLEQVTIVNLGTVTSLANEFNNVQSLKSVIIRADTSAITDTSSMFQNCYALESAPFFDTTNVTNMSNMFNGCKRLTSTPLFNTINVTNMSYMFRGCFLLESVPLLNTANVTNMSYMFYDCMVLEIVPLFNTANVTNMSYMFYNCIVLESVPLFNTANVTNTSYMFNLCSALESVPLFNTAKVTTMSNMFSGCIPLKLVPLFDTANVTVMDSMFSGCASLKTVPLFNTIKVYAFNSMFAGCTTLTSLPAFNTSSGIGFQNIFQNCYSLSYIPAIVIPPTSSNLYISGMFSGTTGIAKISMYGMRLNFSVAGQQLSKSALEEIFTNIRTPSSSVTNPVITITNNFGIDPAVTKSVTTTAQSLVVPISDTTGLTTGMFVTGTGAGITTGISATTTVSTDTITFANHGLTNGSAVSFSNIGTTTGVAINTIYYVKSATTDTFQLSTTTNGTIVNLTGTNSTVVIKYSSYITGIDTNTSITLSTPLATSTTSTLTFRKLDAGQALLKGWTVTY